MVAVTLGAVVSSGSGALESRVTTTSLVAVLVDVAAVVMPPVTGDVCRPVTDTVGGGGGCVNSTYL